MEKRTETDLMFIILTIAYGLAVAYVDAIRTPFNFWLSAAAIFFVCLALGFTQPRRAFRSALVVGGCVLLVFFARRYIDSVSLNIFKAIPTFIPALLGAYCGAMLRKAFAGPLPT